MSSEMTNAKRRAACHAMLDQIANKGLADVLVSLEEFRDYYAHENVAPTPTVPDHAKAPAKIIKRLMPSVKETPFIIEDWHT